MRSKKQRLRLAAAAAISAGLLVPLAAFSGAGLASPSAAQYQYKITICHHTHSTKNPWVTINVSNSALKAHLKHHDTMGACPPKPSTPAPTTTTPAPATTSAGSPASTGHGNNGASHGNSANAPGHNK
jgi:hypothetical protein